MIPKLGQFPPPPLRGDPQTFNDRADPFLAFFPTFQQQMNAAIEEMNTGIEQVNEAVLDSETIKALAPQVQQNATQVAQNTATVIQKTEEVAQNTEQVRQDRTTVEQVLADARALVVGDLAVTDFKPGLLTEPGDYPTPSGNGALSKGNVQDDITEWMSSGSNSAALSRYDVASIATTQTLDLSLSQVFEIDNTSAVTLELINIPASGRAETIVVDVSGSAGVNFNVPDGVTLSWAGGEQPPLGDNWTQFVLIYTGSFLRGGVGYSA